MPGQNIQANNDNQGSLVIPQQQPAFAPQAPMWPSITASVELGSPEGAGLLEKQIYAGAGLSLLNSIGQGLDSILRYEINSQALTEQRKVLVKAYEVKDSIAGKELDAVKAQEETKRKAVDAQVAMLQNNNSTQKDITKLNQQRDIAIASIHERGRNERAKIYATSKAFSIEPAERHYGRPVV